MKAGGGALRALQPAMLRPARIADFVTVAAVLGVGVGIGVHRLTAMYPFLPGYVSSDLHTMATGTGV